MSICLYFVINFWSTCTYNLSLFLSLTLSLYLSVYLLSSFFIHVLRKNNNKNNRKLLAFFHILLSYFHSSIALISFIYFNSIFLLLYYFLFFFFLSIPFPEVHRQRKIITWTRYVFFSSKKNLIPRAMRKKRYFLLTKARSIPRTAFSLTYWINSSWANYSFYLRFAKYFKKILMKSNANENSIPLKTHEF